MPANASTADQNASPREGDVVLEARRLATSYGERTVLDEVSLQARKGEVLAIVGRSGCGKSTLMRHLAMLQPPSAGTVHLFGEEIPGYDVRGTGMLRRRLGVMFQNGALFGDQTVLDNVSVPLREHTDLSLRLIEQVAMVKIAMAGLEPPSAALYPSQLSGGMRKRAAVARGIALDPDILFLDEPSSGLDPISADAMDDLVLQLKETLGLTIILVTHDMDSLRRVADRVVLLADGGIAAQGTVEELVASEEHIARQFFHGRRGRAMGARDE